MTSTGGGLLPGVEGDARGTSLPAVPLVVRADMREALIGGSWLLMSSSAFWQSCVRQGEV